MIKRKATHAMLALTLCLLCLCLPAAAQSAELLRESGVQGGLVVHLGCGDGKLTAALRANSSSTSSAFLTSLCATASAVAAFGSMEAVGHSEK